jgi:ribose-phosphate pyrophosphokinase
MDLKLFTLDPSGTFGSRVATALGIPVAAHEERVFEDGEHKLRPLENVRGLDAYVIHSLHSDATQSTDDKLVRLLFFVGALVDASAARVTAVVPYLCYARKDRRSKPRDPLASRYVASLLEAMGADAVVTLDVHNLAAYQNAFRIRAEHLEAKRLFVDHFAACVGRGPVAVVSPDIGGVKRAEAFRASLESRLARPVRMAFMEKHRSEGVVSGDLFVGDVTGCDVVIVDDLISSGGTIRRAVAACRSAGAARVFAAASHGLFTGNAGELLDDPGLDGLSVTDSVPAFRLDPRHAGRRLHVVDCAPMFAEAIRRMHCGGSLVELMDDTVPFTPAA